nr:glycosyltransferase family 8 protein [Oceanococcus sp. HetDA_MAG_MS8]
MSGAIPNELHVACAADADFAADCATMLVSLMSQHDPNRVVIHFLHDKQLPAPVMAGLASSVARAGGEWRPLAVPHHLIAHLQDSPRYGLSASFRLLLPDLLAPLERVLYLDSDIVVMKSLWSLWERPLNGHCLAAVTNPLYSHMVPRIRDGLGLNEPDRYFNSGVLLMDLKAMRETGRARRLLELVRREGGRFPWVDQDPLNIVYADSRVDLEPRWNAQTAYFQLPRRYLPYSTSEIYEARTQPAIVHFSGPFKPWHYRCRVPYKKEYFRYRRRTDWPDCAVIGESFPNWVLHRIPAVWAYFLELWWGRLRQLKASLKWWRKPKGGPG